MASAPASIERCVSSCEWWVLLVPAPAITVWLGSACLTTLTSSSFSSSVRAGASPVVPKTTTPSEPFSVSSLASRCAPS